MKTQNYYIVRVERDSSVEREFVFLSAKKAESYRKKIAKEYPEGEWRVQDNGESVYEFDLARGHGSSDRGYAGVISVVVVEGESE